MGEWRGRKKMGKMKKYPKWWKKWEGDKERGRMRGGWEEE